MFCLGAIHNFVKNLYLLLIAKSDQTKLNWPNRYTKTRPKVYRFGLRDKQKETKEKKEKKKKKKKKRGKWLCANSYLGTFQLSNSTKSLCVVLQQNLFNSCNVKYSIINSIVTEWMNRMNLSLFSENILAKEIKIINGYSNSVRYSLELCGYWRGFYLD